MRTSHVLILLTFSLTFYMACKNEPCIEIANPDFLIQERLSYIDVSGTPIDTFIETEQIKHLQVYKIIPKQEWDAYDWTITNAFDDTILTSKAPYLIDSSLQDYQRNIMGYRIDFKGTKEEQNLTCYSSGEQIQVERKILRVVPLSNNSSYTQGKYEGHNLSNPQEKFEIKITVSVPPVFPTKRIWWLSGLPKFCKLPLPNMDVRYQAFSISNGHHNPEVCGNLEGLGILSKGNDTLEIHYNYLPEGETKRIVDTFIGTRI